MYKKVYWIGLAVIFFVFNLAGTVSAEISGSQDVTLNYYSISGNKSNSFYVDGDFDVIYEGNVDWKHLTDADEFFGSIYYRATDDSNTDPQEFSIEKFYLGLRNQDREYLLGDFYANFSDYSLGNSLKGIKLDLGLQSEHRLIIVGGMDTSQWEDLWEKRCDDSRSRSYVWGARLENSLLEKKLGLNLNYGGKLDDRAYFSSSNSPVFVNVLSLDSSYLVNDALKLSGEYAYSLTDENTRDSSLKDKGDPAFNLGLEYNISRYSLTTDYSRIYSHFNSTGGFTSQDLESFGLNGIWFMPFNIKCTHYLNADRDNLTKAQSTTTKQLNPGVKFGFELPWQIRAESGFDMRKRFSADKSTNERTNTYSAGLGKEFKYCYTSLSYARTRVYDKVQSSQERYMDDIVLGLDGNFNVKDVRLSWALNEDFHYEHHKEAKKSDLTLNHSLGLKADFPSTLRMETRFSIADNDYYLNDTDSYNTDLYFAVSRDLKDNLYFNISYQRKKYNYATASNNYREAIASANLNYRF